MKNLLASLLEKRIVEDTRKKIRLEVSRIGIKDGILDLGCGGNGSFAYNGLKVVGADKHKERLERLKAYKKVIVDADKKLPFKGNTFKVVIFAGVIQYLKNYRKAIKEVNRILKSDGILILTTVNRSSSLRRLGMISKEAKKERGEYQTFDTKQLVSLLHESGFKIKKIIGSDFTLMPRNLSSNIIFIAIKSRG